MDVGPLGHDLDKPVQQPGEPDDRNRDGDPHREHTREQRQHGARDPDGQHCRPRHQAQGRGHPRELRVGGLSAQPPEERSEQLQDHSMEQPGQGPDERQGQQQHNPVPERDPQEVHVSPCRGEEPLDPGQTSILVECGHEAQRLCGDQPYGRQAGPLDALEQDRGRPSCHTSPTFSRFGDRSSSSRPCGSRLSESKSVTRSRRSTMVLILRASSGASPGVARASRYSAARSWFPLAAARMNPSTAPCGVSRPRGSWVADGAAATGLSAGCAET